MYEKMNGKQIGYAINSLNGTEQVTLPVSEFSWFQDGTAAEEIDGTRKVSVLSASNSKTLFDS